MRYTCLTVRGAGRGKTLLGFPTFNLVIPPEFSAREGVYACRVWIAGQEYRGALHYGPTPTFDQKEKALEIFVLNYASGDPVAELAFELGPYLRPVATFLSARDLRTQIALDVQRVRRIKFSDEQERTNQERPPKKRK